MTIRELFTELFNAILDIELSSIGVFLFSTLSIIGGVYMIIIYKALVSETYPPPVIGATWKKKIEYIGGFGNIFKEFLRTLFVIVGFLFLSMGALGIITITHIEPISKNVGIILNVIAVLFFLHIFIDIFAKNFFLLFKGIIFNKKNRLINFLYIIEYVVLAVLYVCTCYFSLFINVFSLVHNFFPL